jgi:hypothetical protein
LPAAALGFLGPGQETNGRRSFLFALVFAVIAALGCWLLTRNKRCALTHGAEQRGKAYFFTPFSRVSLHLLTAGCGM